MLIQLPILRFFKATAISLFDDWRLIPLVALQSRSAQDAIGWRRGMFGDAAPTGFRRARDSPLFQR